MFVPDQGQAFARHRDHDVEPHGVRGVKRVLLRGPALIRVLSHLHVTQRQADFVLQERNFQVKTLVTEIQ